MTKIKIYANLVINGLKVLDEIPAKYRLAVETLVNETLTALK
jgi:hypothetical protein